MNKRVDYHKKAGKKNRHISSNQGTHERGSPSRESARDGGASHSGVSQRAILQAWLAHHRFSCVDSLGRLLRTPWQSLLTWMVIAIGIVLPAALYLGLQNVQSITEGWQGKAQVSLFLRRQAKPEAIAILQQRLSNEPEFSQVTVITPEQARQDFQQYAGLGNILDSLSNNPLPSVMVLTLADSVSSDQLDSLQGRLQQETLVDVAQLDIAWLQRLMAMTDLAQRIVTAFAGLLALGVLLIVGNTIRLEIESRREEIIVTKMVGGTDGFVRRPFLYSGLWYGCGGAVIALALLVLAEVWIAKPLHALLFTYESEYLLTWVAFDSGLSILVLSTFLGVLGAWLAVTRHLRHIEPA